MCHQNKQCLLTPKVSKYEMLWYLFPNSFMYMPPKVGRCFLDHDQVFTSLSLGKFCKRETLNLLTCANSSTNIKTDESRQKGKEKGKYVTGHVSCDMCHVLRVACCLSPVTCHLSLMPQTSATNTPPANSPIIHSRLVCKDLKT